MPTDTEREEAFDAAVWALIRLRNLADLAEKLGEANAIQSRSRDALEALGCDRDATEEDVDVSSNY